jgi:L-ascorbate metabolism protein UlaG (beta-lactamase superfamily)
MKIKLTFKCIQILCVAMFALSHVAAFGAENATKLTWYGHSAFRITTPKGKVLVVDPWLTNPLNPAAKGPTPEAQADAAIAAVGKVDYILVTHGHFDHVSDAAALAKKTHAKLVTNFELGNNMVKLLGFPKESAGMDTLGNMGGEIVVADGEVTIDFVPAIHSSGLDSGKDNEAIAYGGNPMGFVIRIKNGPTIYHTGDTAYFSDMELIGKRFHPDVALINIGGHFGMEPEQAAQAAQAVKAKLVIPHHYKTFPILTQDAGPFFRMLDQKHIAHLEMKPGQTVEFDGTHLKK